MHHNMRNSVTSCSTSDYKTIKICFTQQLAHQVLSHHNMHHNTTWFLFCPSASHTGSDTPPPHVCCVQALNSIASQTGFGVTDTTNGVINTTTLDDVLSYNVVPGQALTTADFTNGMKLKNMKGETLVVAVRGSSAARMALAGDATAMIMINNATIVKGDIAAGKAIIHEVDMILLPRTYQAVLDSITTGDLAATSEDPLADLEMSSSSDVDDMSSSTMDDPLAGLIASAGDVETEDVEDMPANATIMMAATTKPTPVVASPAPATATVVAATPRPATTTAAITSTATPATVAPQQSGATTAFLSAMLVAVPALTLLL